MPLRYILLCALNLAAVTTPALGRSRDEPDDDVLLEQQQQQQLQQQTPVLPGRVAESAVGRVGQRQTREEAAPNVHPMHRISNRIENRIQSRIDSRIDRDYDPQANTRSPFAVAEERSRINADAGR